MTTTGLCHDINTYIREYKVSMGCYECGIHDPDILLFHHINPDNKVASISDMVRDGALVSEIADEIRKCVVVCWNCHRKIHGDINFYRSISNDNYSSSSDWEE